MQERSILVYDTTLRDGTQGEGVSLSLQDKLNIAVRLSEVGVDMIEGGYPLSNEKDAMFFQKAKQLKLSSSLLAAFGMTRRRGMKAADDPGIAALLDAETPVITIVGKSWDFHATEVLGVSLQENLDMIGETVEYLSRYSQIVYDAEHYFDGYKANPQYALSAVETAAKAGTNGSSSAIPMVGRFPNKSLKLFATPKIDSMRQVPNWGFTAITMAIWLPPTPWLLSRLDAIRCKGPSTGSASVAETPIWFALFLT